MYTLPILTSINHEGWKSLAEDGCRQEEVVIMGSMSQEKKDFFRRNNKSFIHRGGKMWSLPTQTLSGEHFTSLTPQVKYILNKSFNLLIIYIMAHQISRVIFSNKREALIGFHEDLGDDVLRYIVDGIRLCRIGISIRREWLEDSVKENKLFLAGSLTEDQKMLLKDLRLFVIPTMKDGKAFTRLTDEARFLIILKFHELHDMLRKNPGLEIRFPRKKVLFMGFPDDLGDDVMDFIVNSAHNATSDL